MKQRDCYANLQGSLGMSDWTPHRLGDLGTTYTGLSGKKKDDFGRGCNYIPYVNILDNSRIDPEEMDQVHIKSGENQNRVQRGDIFFTTSSETVEDVGLSSVLLDELPNTYLNSFCFGFRPYDLETILPEFAAHLLRADHMRRRISYLGQGSTRYNISKTQLLKRLVLEAPGEDEQRRIALILDTADAAIAKTEALIAKLKQMKAGLLHDLLTRGIDESSGYSFLQGKVLDNPWRVETLAEKLCFITDYRGKTPPRSKHGIPIISAEVVLNGRLKPTVKWVTEAVYKEWTTRGFPEPGDVIFTTEAPVGEVAPVPDHTVLLTRRVIALRPTDDVNKRFLYWFLYWLNSIGFWKPRSRGTTVPRILKPDILSISIPVPSENEQESIVSTLDSVETRIENEIVVLEKQKLLKAGLMNDLLTGKKPVFAEAAAAT